MRLSSKWNRRSFLGSAGVFAGSILAPRKLFSLNRGATGASPKKKTATVTGFGQSGSPYEELGVTTVINCEGTMTVLGGSLPHPELEAVMTMAGRCATTFAVLRRANPVPEPATGPGGRGTRRPRSGRQRPRRREGCEARSRGRAPRIRPSTSRAVRSG